MPESALREELGSTINPEDLEFGFDDDLVFLDRVIGMLVTCFLQNYSGSYEIQDITTFFQDMLVYSNSIFSRQHKRTYIQFSKSSNVYKRRMLAEVALLDRLVLLEIEKHNPSQLTSDAFTTLASSQFSNLCKLDQNGDVVLPGYSTSPAMTWYTRVFFEQILVGPSNGFAFYTDSVESFATNFHRNQVLNASVMGYLLGFFSNHPNSEWYCYTFRRLSKVVELPAFVLEAIQKDRQPQNSRRLQHLKAFWHDYFVHSWMLSQSINPQRSLLSPLDFAVAQRTQQPSETFSTPSEARRHGQLAAARSNTFNSQQSVVEYQHQQHQLQERYNKSQQQLLKRLTEILQEYHPDLIPPQFDFINQPVHWRVFFLKIDRLLQVATKELAKINSCPDEEVGQLLESCVSHLIDVVHRPYQNKTINIVQFFGTSFFSLSKIEQVTLIVFTCLSLSKTNKQTHALAVGQFSNTLYSMLLKHYDQENPPEYQPTSKPPQFKPGDFEMDPQTLDWLSNTKIGSGLVWTQAPAYLRQMKEMYQAFAPLSKLIENASSMGHAKLLMPYLLLALGIVLIWINEGMRLASVTLFIPTSIHILLTRLRDTKAMQRLIETEKLVIHEELQTLVSDFAKKRMDRRRSFHVAATVIVLVLNAFILFGPDITTQLESVQEMTGLFSSSMDGTDVDVTSRNTPGEVSPEALRNIPYSIRAKVIFPEGEEPDDGTSLGYLSHNLLLSGRDQLALELREFESVSLLDSIDQAPLVSSGTIHVMPSIINPLVIPFKNFEILEVYQVGGEKPLVDSLGNLHYSQDNLPTELLLVQAPLESIDHSGVGKIEEFSGRSLPQYNFWNDWENKLANAYRINEQLGGDLELQNLHLGFIQAVDQVVVSHNQGLVSDFQARSMARDILVHYADLIIRYTDEERTYSLRFKKTRYDELGEYLKELSQLPNSGYNCSVAASFVTDFFMSLGFSVIENPGANTLFSNGLALIRIGHVMNLIWSPDGSALYLDATPTRPNPGEDLSMLQHYIPSFEEIEAAKHRLEAETIETKKQKIATVAVILGLISSGFVIFGLSREMLQWQKKRKRQLVERITAVLSPEPESLLATNPEIADSQASPEYQFSTQVLAAVEHILVYLVDESKTYIEGDLYLNSEVKIYRLVQDVLSLLNSHRESSGWKAQMRVRGLLTGVSASSIFSTVRELKDQIGVESVLNLDKSDTNQFQLLLGELIKRLDKKMVVYPNEDSSDRLMPQKIQAVTSILRIIIEEVSSQPHPETGLPDLQSLETD